MRRTGCFWKSLQRMGSWRRPLSREHCSQSLSRQVIDTHHTPHEHISFFENISLKICHLLVPKVSLAAILAHIHGTYADKMILWKYNLDSKEIKWLPDSISLVPSLSPWGREENAEPAFRTLRRWGRSDDPHRATQQRKVKARDKMWI